MIRWLVLLVLTLTPAGLAAQGGSIFTELDLAAESRFGNMMQMPDSFFYMGSNTGPASTRPKVRVTVPSHALDRYEVTVGEFAGFLNRHGHNRELVNLWVRLEDMQSPIRAQAGRYTFTESNRHHPMTHVTYHGARAYCRIQGKRLPTESEFEHAATRQGTQAYAYGPDYEPDAANTPSLMIANYHRQFRALRGGRGTLPVGTLPMESFGTYDLGGNVSEWVLNHWVPSHGERANASDPNQVLAAAELARRQGMAGPARFTVRGPAWTTLSPEMANSRDRFGVPADFASNYIGFRCAVSGTIIDTADTPQVQNPIPERFRDDLRTRPTPEGVVISFENVLFDLDEALIRPDAEPILREVASWLLLNPEYRLRIAGHADERGSLVYNQRLSERRAEAVRAFLIEQGLTEARIETNAFGETNPEIDGESEEIYQRNRRVEIQVLTGE